MRAGILTFQPKTGTFRDIKSLLSGSQPRILPSAVNRRLAPVHKKASPVLAKAAVQAPPDTKEVLSLEKFDAGVTIEVSKTNGFYDVDISAASDNLTDNVTMHWAVEGWTLPDQSIWPEGTVKVDDKAVQTKFGPQRQIHLRFDADSCPSRVVFVLKDGDNWMNAGAGDFAAYLKPPGTKEIVDKVMEAESEYTHWSLFNRFCLASELLEAADAAGPEGMALMTTWLRLSNMRQLDWYRNSNYQSKDAAHVQKNIAQRMADKARSAKDPFNRLFARMCLAGLPRGGGNGDDIRHGILNVMRENGIKEGHRPGIDDKFLESWHQKLHTNTTPEDVTICEAYLAFLHSGNMDDFWRVCWDNGKLTPESLTNMDHPLNVTPFHLPQLIGPMQHYLWILKVTHSGADLDVALTMAKGSMDGELAWMIEDILNNRYEWWVPGKIVEARRRLKGVWMSPTSRDVLLLDIALDNYFRLCVERTDKGALQPNDLFSLVQLVLDNASIAAESEELTNCAALWGRVGADNRWSGQEWAQLALAASDNVALCLEAYADRIVSLVQPHAERFGDACKIDEQYIVNFSEEVVRSQPVFMLSVLLRYLDPHLRAAAGVGAFQVVSQAHVPAGKVMVMEDLVGIQGKTFEDGPPIVVIAETLTGNEDIPLGIAAVLTSSATDVLSHVAIRARAQGVLLASCFDPADMDKFKLLDGSWVEAGVLPTGDVAVTATAAPTGAASGAGGKSGGAGAAPAVKLVKAPTTSKEWVLSESQFEGGAVGGKSRNLAILRGKVPASIGVPSSIALPYGTFERVLKDKANAAAAKAVAAAEKQLEDFAKKSKGTGIPAALKELRTIVRNDLVAPDELIEDAAKAAVSAGLIGAASEWTAAGSAEWDEAWTAICRVWASKWNDRAWLSRIAIGIPESDLSMAVLIQTIVAAEYAFVLHTADPLTGAAGHLRGEMVRGMGEALVGNYPGRPLAFEKQTPTSDINILAMPSKRQALMPSLEGSSNATKLLIARSDSNGEDLEGFAGAGLYSSVPFVQLDTVAVRYADEALVWDADFRSDLLTRIAKAGEAVEAAFGSPQDVEGAVDGEGNIIVVQSRPQVF